MFGILNLGIINVLLSIFKEKILDVRRNQCLSFILKTMKNSNERRLKYPNVRYMSAANYFSRCVINIFSFLPFVVQLQLKDTWKGYKVDKNDVLLNRFAGGQNPYLKQMNFKCCWGQPKSSKIFVKFSVCFRRQYLQAIQK